MIINTNPMKKPALAHSESNPKTKSNLLTTPSLSISHNRISSTASTSSIPCTEPSPNQEISSNTSLSFISTHTRPDQDFKPRLPRTFPSRAKLPAVSINTNFMSPARALLQYFECLTPAEREEISLYDEIYFVGPNCSKNTGQFADDDGYYIAVAGDHLEYRYEIQEALGSGTFGQVFKCFDYKRSVHVAVKIIRNKNTYRKAGDLENKILHELAKADPNDLNCIVKKLRSFEFRGHLCLVFELLSINLFQFLHRTQYCGISTTLVRRIAAQLFMALKTVHAVGIIHCDLKPDNILLKSEHKSSIKVIDFGSACQEGNKVFDYIQSRYYRSPEVLFDTGYSTAIDIWSVGCILYELVTGKTLFPADNEQELFKMMVEVLGMPPADFYSKGKRKHHYIDISGNSRRRVNPLSSPLKLLLSSHDDRLIDLLEKCLKWRPEERLEAESGLSHIWVRGKPL